MQSAATAKLQTLLVAFGTMERRRTEAWRYFLLVVVPTTCPSRCSEKFVSGVIGDWRRAKSIDILSRALGQTSILENDLSSTQHMLSAFFGQ